MASNKANLIARDSKGMGMGGDHTPLSPGGMWGEVREYVTVKMQRQYTSCSSGKWRC